MSDIITQILGKFKGVVFLLLILISFFLGRTYKFLENKPSFYFSENPESLQSPRTLGTVNRQTIVASSGGKKYYYVWCKGAENIKEKNKRYFADEGAAEMAGYSKAASCK